MAMALFILNSILSQQPADQEIDKQEKIFLSSIKQDIVIWKKRCEGICWSIQMDLPSNGSWTDPLGSYPWYPSHGSPTVSPNSIWMWSYNNYGEGVNLTSNFLKGKRYCLETTMKLSLHPQAVNYSQGTINIKLTQNTVNNLPNYTLPTVSPTFPVRQSLFTSLYPPTTSQTFIDNFIPDGNYGNVWFYPLNPQDGQIQMQLTAVNICLNEPCESLKITFKYKQICSSFYFYPFVFGLASGFNVVGYLWEFGDGTTSNLPFPNHVYAFPGGYGVTLTVYTKNSKTGECCSKKISWKVEAKQCDPCKELINSLSVITTNQGAMIKYEPNLPANPNYLYNWNFSDSTNFSSREVYKNSYLSGSLTIYLAGQDKCCEVTKKFGKIIFEQIDALDNQEVTFSN